ncbi:MAG: SusD/RagB family nutrient-binding outer membrane lipoprotein [Arachidicoccus sp.]|nr:SusD/RagB family nutrient-binding outer membrane lipoprotein [Arachidicoccus sp.]
MTNISYKTKFIYAAIGFICTSPLITGCTKNFEKWNTDKYAASNTALLQGVGTSQLEIFHDYQTGINLAEDSWSGYLMSPTIGNFNSGKNNLNYSFAPNWQNSSFNPAYRYVMADFNALYTKGLKSLFPEVYAITRLTEVTAIARVTDRFGSIPYSQVDGTVRSSYTYDAQKDVYSLMFLKIDTALSLLKDFIQTNSGIKSQVGNNDFVYGGDCTKWIKYANTLRLRLAMHIVKADAATAKLQGEKALADAGGLLTDASDAAKIKIYSGWNGGTNDYNLVAGWGDTRANAAIITYMNGYNDPRISKYFLPATDSSVLNQYIGLRIGGIINHDIGVGYSNLNVNGAFSQTSPQLIMSAAEAWFLKAEAALREWNSAGNIQADYEQGIAVSMNEWGASIGNYLSNDTGKETSYTDPNGEVNNSPALSTITIKWDDAATKEQKLERIITQKWIAMFPDGADAWADYRRTGYPLLFPVVVNNSGGTIDTDIQIRRIPYPSDQIRDNKEAVDAAVQNTLGGNDDGGQRVWWDVNKTNF